MRKTILAVLVTMMTGNMLPAAQTAASSSGGFPDAAELNRMAARFAPTEMKVDTSGLSVGDKQALEIGRAHV